MNEEVRVVMLVKIITPDLSGEIEAEIGVDQDTKITKDHTTTGTIEVVIDLIGRKRNVTTQPLVIAVIVIPIIEVVIVQGITSEF